MADSNVHRRGFASMDKERVREIASRGGTRAQDRGTAHRWTTESARAANQKALESRRRRKAAESQT